MLHRANSDGAGERNTAGSSFNCLGLCFISLSVFWQNILKNWRSNAWRTLRSRPIDLATWKKLKKYGLSRENPITNVQKQPNFACFYDSNQYKKKTLNMFSFAPLTIFDELKRVHYLPFPITYASLRPCEESLFSISYHMPRTRAGLILAGIWPFSMCRIFFLQKSSRWTFFILPQGPKRGRRRT